MLNLFTPEFIANPYPYYRRLRGVDPVFKVPDGPWLVTRYDDVSRILRDRRFGRHTDQGFAKQYGDRALEEPLLAMLSRWALLADPPAHRRLRGPMMKAFGAWQVGDLRPRIQQTANQLIDRVEARGRADLVADYARALSLAVICDLIGIPIEDRSHVLSHLGFTDAALGGLPLERAKIDRANAQILGLEEYLRGLVARRRGQPASDLISALLAAEESGDRLSEAEIIANIILLFVAGYETTADFIANGVLALHQHPRELQRFRDEPGIAANAIEELLRFEPAVKHVIRSALEDVELGGKLIRTGDWVVALLAAGNRDPAVFAAPDRLDIGRPNIRPLSFGGGIHFCLGAQLGRLETEIAITSLLRRLPTLRIHDLEKPEWRPMVVFRSLERLRASW